MSWLFEKTNKITNLAILCKEKEKGPTLGMRGTHVADGADVKYLREGCDEPYVSKLKSLNVMGKIVKKYATYQKS